MATNHVYGQNWTLEIKSKGEGKGSQLIITADVPDELHATAKMEMLLSTSGFTPTSATLADGRPLKANVQVGVSKAK